MEQNPQKDQTSDHRLTEGEQVKIRGTLHRFTFRSADTGFAVVRLKPEAGELISVVGHLAQLKEGQEVIVSGEVVVHPRFGPQIQAQTVEAILPNSTDGITAYLASNLVKGIGPATAAKITEHFGTETLQIIEEEPERLQEIKGLGAQRIHDLVEAVCAHKDIQAVMVFLRTHGLGENLAAKIVKQYGSNASALIEANPYRLADEVIGIGFRTADQLAIHLGIEHDAPERLQAGILFLLQQAAREGHCYLAIEELNRRSCELLGSEADAIEQMILPLTEEGRIAIEHTQEDVDDNRCVFPVALHQSETGVAIRIAQLADAPVRDLLIHPEQAVARFMESGNLRMPEQQRQAVIAALQYPVTVITGGPGVGKTTIIRALSEILTGEHRKLLLGAPTGRAAKRLGESTGRGARTIHRLLEYQPGVNRFTKDEFDQLEGDMLVIDEASMLDIQLAYSLLRAVPLGMRLVLVGDVDQLPSVGPGNVLRDIIESQRVPVTALTEIFRQDEGSLIVEAAHSMLRGEVPRSGDDGSDFFFIETADSKKTREVIRELVTRRIPQAFDLDPLTDIQVLCPMYRGDAGADALNHDLQGEINSQGPMLERSGRTFVRGDKVMQIRNDYETDVFNGDIGKIEVVEPSQGRLTVRFGNRLIEYGPGELDQIVLAYAISVHRSQGSEYPAVVIPMATEHFMMLRRNLLYTAITRGRRLVVLVGSPKAFAIAVRNNQEASRNSLLDQKLRLPDA